MKLEVGMYVRTKKGKIYKFDTNNSMAKNGAKKYMVNCSYNLIDLIKVGDYVNGYKVTRIGGTYHGRKDRAIYCDYQENEKTGKWIMIYDDEIKSIVTKEQFESMKYNLEG